MSEAPLIRVERLVFGYPNGANILNGCDLELWPGQAIGLRGANGSGKTTLFRCLAGLCQLKSGQIFLNGGMVGSSACFNALRRKIGYLLQDSEDQIIFPVVLEDVAFGPLNLGLSADEADAAARESLNMVGLAGFENRLARELSGGEKKLAALAGILAMRPEGLFLDEPLNGLDGNARKRVARILADLPCAKLVASHDADFLREIRAESVWLENGVLRKG